MDDVSVTTSATISVTARFFAAAEEAVGAAELTIELHAGSSIRDALTQASDGEGLTVLRRCSFLLNSEATTDVSTVLESGDELDVLPPFAGG